MGVVWASKDKESGKEGFHPYSLSVSKGNVFIRGLRFFSHKEQSSDVSSEGTWDSAAQWIWDLFSRHSPHQKSHTFKM